MMFDKKGWIITVDAPRPSDPEIIGFIESHLKTWVTPYFTYNVGLCIIILQGKSFGYQFVECV